MAERFSVRCLVRNTSVVAITALAFASAGCGSPMRAIRSAGLTTGSVYGVAVEIVAIQHLTSRGVGEHPMTTDESGTFAVAKDVVRSDGTVLIAKGTRVTARVTRKEHTRLARPGWLEVVFLSTQAATGTPVRLDEKPMKFEGESRKPGMITGAVILWWYGLLFLLRTGGDVTLQAGSTFIANGWILELPAVSR